MRDLFNLVLLTGLLTLAGCGGSSSPTSPTPPVSSSPTPPPAAPAAPPAGVSTAQATAVATAVGGLTITALRSGATPVGIFAINPAPRARPLAASGQVYSSLPCPVTGKVELIYVRDYTAIGGDFDLSALKAVYTACTFTANSGSFEIAGELMLSGHYFGTRQAPTIRTSGALTTSSGACAIDGSVAATGSFGGAACGATLTNTTTAPPSGSFDVSGQWAGSVTITKPGQAETEPVLATFQHVGQSLSGAASQVLDNPDAVVATFGLTQTAASGNTLTFSGAVTFPGPLTLADGPCPLSRTLSGTLTVDTSARTISGSFTGQNSDCDTETDAFSLVKQ